MTGVVLTSSVIVSGVAGFIGGFAFAESLRKPTVNNRPRNIREENQKDFTQ